MYGTCLHARSLQIGLQTLKWTSCSDNSQRLRRRKKWMYRMTCKKSTDLSPCLTIPTPVWCYTTTFLTDECIALTRRWTVSRHIVSSANFNAIRSRRQYLYSSENSNSQCVLCCCCCCCVHFVRVINRQTNEPPNNEFKFTEWKCDVIYAWFSLQFSTFILIHVLGLSLSFFFVAHRYYRIFRSVFGLWYTTDIVIESFDYRSIFTQPVRFVTPYILTK